MISKLKRKFTLLATISMLILMTILLLIMNLLNYSSVVGDCDEILNVLFQPGAPFLEESEGRERPDEGMKEFIPRGMSPEVPYEARYFTAMVDGNGEVREANLSNIISVDSTSVQEFIRKAVERKSDRGFIGQFRYVRQSDDRVTRILFLDCGRKLDAFRKFFFTSSIVGLFGCMVVFIAFLLVSGRIVKPIAESYEKQKRFISDAGHEIKTPLTVINANVDLLECDGEKEELTEIRSQTGRLTELTNHLVCLSRMEEAEDHLQKVALPMSDLVEEEVSPFIGVAAAGNVVLTKSIQPDISITGSPDEIRQLISLLLENGVKYTSSGGMITVTLSSGKKHVSLSVFNTTSEKVSAGELNHVFDRFYRRDSSRNSSTGGHGLGLSIAKAIMERHGGSITAVTKTGFDFRITAEFPL